ncbi:hypothetical protein [Guptibacillus hwajinpoensis]|uniref:hypothetical protein n=1 Tax=Guptibacillus hwajinpoensis TaxID=208199 RepID=UPI001CFE3DA4|nr:hypothetical protein [Pseudalkalibacillus hwajinpoensis]WLR58898.1 hypothetical protein LC071_17295 [Pseudalkalibacillus hwajinpoensis]
MIEVIVTIIFSIVFLIGIYIQVTRRKRVGLTGFKSAISPICFLISAALNPLGYWFGFLGLYSLLGSMLFLLIGAYFLKEMQMPKAHERRENV